MPLSRKKRTSLFRQQVEKEWREYSSFLHPFTFNYEKKIFIEKRMREYLAAYRIQQYYLTALCDPYCRIGLTRIKRHYHECFNEDSSMKKLPADFKLI